jgi:hypothetical protein
MTIAPAMTPNSDMPPEEPQEDPSADHRANLAEFLEEDDLTTIASELIELVEADNGSRSEWIDTYTSGLDYLGFKGDERSEPFKGASGVYHPVLVESVVRFQSNAIMEIFPANGPVLTKIFGDETPEKVALSKRVKEEMNYQLTENMKEYRNETEQLLFRLSLAGSVFKKCYYDPLKKRPSSCMVPAEDFIVDYGSSDLENSERYTHVMRKSPNQVKKLQRVGFYRKVKLPKPAAEVPPDGKEKENEITGIEPVTHIESQHTLYEVHVYYNLPGILSDPDEVADPYIITIEKQSQKVLAIYRNWNEDDDQRVAEQYFVHFQYMPALGFYGIGLIHLIGSIAKATTSILRQLIDAGTLSNLPGGLKTRGLRTKGDDTPIAPGEWRDVDVPAGTIQQNLFPMPYKEPSAVLAQLLQMLVEEGRRVGSIADTEITAQTMSAPVGTTLALLERSMKVMTAVHARLHASLRREFGLIAKCIHDYMDPHYAWDETQQFNRQQDFDGRTVDVVPISDPNASTQAHRIIQAQAVQQLASQNPELYNLKELHRAGLQAIGVKNDERILPQDQPPPRMDPVQENMAMLTSQPCKVFPDQDHTAHIQVHLSLMTDPKILEMLKASPSAAKIQGQMEAHMAEHLAFQYHDEIQQVMGVQLPPLGEQQPPEVEGMLSRALADASVRLRELHETQAKQKQAEQIANDPVFQLREREVAIKEKAQAHKERVDAIDTAMEIGKEGKDEKLQYEKIASQERQTGAKIGADLVTFGATLDNETRQQGIEFGKEIIGELHSDAMDEAKTVSDIVGKHADSQHQRALDSQQHDQKLEQDSQQHEQKLEQDRQQHEQKLEHAKQQHAQKLKQMRSMPKPTKPSK